MLVIAAGADFAKETATKAEVAATNKDSLYLAAHLPKATTSLHMIPDALHFSFLQICKEGAVQLIEAESPGEGIVCTDGGNRDRDAIHRETVEMVLIFLAKSLRAE
ncbi:MAG TPA: lipoprotein signal peptide, partial [Pararhizobium sp.]|nr:lipoprotein signal peptide [Pararhizobium sp.]